MPSPENEVYVNLLHDALTANEETKKILRALISKKEAPTNAELFVVCVKLTHSNSQIIAALAADMLGIEHV